MISYICGMFNHKKMLCKHTFLFLAFLAACVLVSCGGDSASSSSNTDEKISESPVLNCTEMYGMPDNVEWTSDASENIYARQEILKAIAGVLSENYKKILLYYDSDSNNYRARVSVPGWYRSFDDRYEITFKDSVSTSIYGCSVIDFGSRYYGAFFDLDSCLCKRGENGETLFSKSATPINMELENENVVIVDTNLCKDQYNAMMQKESEEFKGVYGVYIDIRDNQVYKTTEIGKQTWLAENMRYRGTPDDVLDFDYSRGIGDPETIKTYLLEDSVRGIYYKYADWEKICPAGFHLPSQEEWYELIKFVMDDQQLECDYAFAYLKNPENWLHAEDDPGFDVYGFSDRAEGGYDVTLGLGGVYNKGSQTYYAAKDALCSIGNSNLKFGCTTTATSSLRGPVVINSVAPIRCVKD